MREDTLALTVSGRVYRLLLFTYPAPFRRRYGAEMAQVFRDQCRHVAGRNGLSGLFILWLALLPDLVRSAFAEHLWEAFNMSFDKFLRGSGLAAILAGILWVTLFVVASEFLDWDAFSNVITALLFVLIMALFAFGLAGVRRRYPSLLYVRLSFAVVYLSIVWLVVGGLITLFAETGWAVFISGFFLFAFGLLSPSCKMNHIIASLRLALPAPLFF